MSEESEDIIITISESEIGVRLDKFLSDKIEGLSRSRLQTLIDQGLVLVNDRAMSSSYKTKLNDMIVVEIPPAEDDNPVPQDIPIDIVYEDEDVIVINKQNGLVVHPAVGNRDGTLVNALLFHCADTLSGINGVKRPGIVHRLDKDTSGLMIVAKHDQAHNALAAQLQSRELSRVYHAVTIGVPQPSVGSIEQMIARHPQQRLKMAVTTKLGRYALTNYKVLENFHDQFSLNECRLSTGRTHQIRVHMEWLGYPLLGDTLYGAPETKLNTALKKGGYIDKTAIHYIQSYPYQALHAREISFIHPRTNRTLTFTADYSDSFKELYKHLSAS